MINLISRFLIADKYEQYKILALIFCIVFSLAALIFYGHKVNTESAAMCAVDCKERGYEESRMELKPFRFNRIPKYECNCYTQPDKGARIFLQ